MAWPDAPHGPADAAHRLARRFEAMTGHRHRIALSHAQGPDETADLYFGAAHDFSALHPSYAYFAGLPGSSGLGADGLAQWMAVGGGQMLWDDLAASHGWKPLLAGHLGEAPPLWSRVPISGLGSLAGQRIVATGLAADVARALGAEPAGGSFATAKAALAQGEAEAAEVGGLVTSLASGIAAVAPHATGSGFHAGGTALALHVRLPVWHALSDADRAILEAACNEAYQLAVADAETHAEIARRVLSTSLGVTFAPWPGDVTEALERVAEATIAHVAAHDAVSERIDQSYCAFRAQIGGKPDARRPAAMAAFPQGRDRSSA